MGLTKTSRIWTIPAQEFAELVKSSTSVAEIVRGCGFGSISGSYSTVKRRIKTDGLDVSHIPSGLGSNRGRKFSPELIPLDQILVEGSSYSRASLKRRLIRDGLIENKCAKCGLGSTWNDELLILRLDHINGVNDDNRLNNLRLLCPNCDSQTSTFSGRNAAQWKCLTCRKKVGRRVKYCKTCRPAISRVKFRKIEWPPLKELSIMLEQSSMVEVGRRLGVSDNAVRKMMNRMRMESNER